MMGVGISCGSVLGEGALRMRKRCLIDMLLKEAALSGRGGGGVDAMSVPLLLLFPLELRRCTGSSGRGGSIVEGGGRGAVKLSLNAR